MFWMLLAAAAKLFGPATTGYMAGGFLAEKFTGKDNKSPLVYTDDIVIGSAMFKGPFVFMPEESNNVMGFLVYEHQYETAINRADVDEARRVQARIDVHQSRCYKIQTVLETAKARAGMKDYAYLL